MDKNKSGLADSGCRETYKGGAQRERKPGKGRYDLISPIMMHRLAVLMEQGAIKYAARNWETGIPLSACIDSALRHAEKAKMRLTNEDHAIQAIFNLMIFVHQEEMIRLGKLAPEFDDVPKIFEGVPEETLKEMGILD